MKHFLKRIITNICVFAILLVGIKTYTNLTVTVKATSMTSKKVEEKVTVTEELSTQQQKYLTQAYYDRCQEGKYDFANDYDIYNSLTYPLAKVIYAEVGGIHQNKIQQYVGYVFINLMNSKYYPDTVEGVLNQCYAITTAQKFQKGECSEEALENAKVVVNNYYNGTMPVSPAMIYQAEFEQGVNRFKIENEWFGEDTRILNDLKNSN